MKRNWLILLCLCLAFLTACQRQPEQPNNGVQPRNLTEQQAAGEQAGTEKGLADLKLPGQTFRLVPLAHPENGTREALILTNDQAGEEELTAIQGFLDSLTFETADYSQWVGDDLARSMEGEYCLLEIDTARYFVCIAPLSSGVGPGFRHSPPFPNPAWPDLDSLVPGRQPSGPAAAGGGLPL